jgi:hypothetical protein
VRATLRRMRQTCLVNSIVLQAWQAAHGHRRDLVVGVTGPDRFHAHAWLEGDAVPTVDDPAIEVSALEASLGNGLEAPRQGINGSGAPDRGEAGGTPAGFTELLRRPAPGYSGVRFPQRR